LKAVIGYFVFFVRMYMTNIILKNKVSIEKMRCAGQSLASILEEVKELVKPGQSTLSIDTFIEQRMHEAQLKPVCKGYAGYQFATCISLNDTIVHGIPSKEVILKSGDFVKIDVVGAFKGYCADLARYFFVGEVRPTAHHLALTAQQALDGAIAKVGPGIRLSDISSFIQRHVEAAGFNVIRDFAGHGIGKSMHEAPQIPNYGTPGNGPELREGMALALEPMITEKGYQLRIMSDGWTARTVDGGLAAHVEDTVIVTKNGAEVLTRL
jgi:methionyl aminopeptidase